MMCLRPACSLCKCLFPLNAAFFYDYMTNNRPCFKPHRPTTVQESDKQKHVLNLEAPGFSLKKGFDHKASVYNTYEEAKSGKGQSIATGNISIGDAVFADWDDVNMDPAAENDHQH